MAVPCCRVIGKLNTKLKGKRMDIDSLSLTTWKALVEREPRLQRVLETAQRIKDDPDLLSFCANRTFCDELEWEMHRLVGWSRSPRDAILSSSEAWDSVHRMLYAQIPNCRNCRCS